MKKVIAVLGITLVRALESGRENYVRSRILLGLMTSLFSYFTFAADERFLSNELRWVAIGFGSEPDKLAISALGFEQIRKAKELWSKDFQEKQFFVRQTKEELLQIIGFHRGILQSLYREAKSDSSRAVIAAMTERYEDELRNGLPDFDYLVAAVAPNNRISQALDQVARLLERFLVNRAEMAKAAAVISKPGSTFDLNLFQRLADYKFRAALGESNSELLESLKDQLDRFHAARLMSKGGADRGRFFIQLPDMIFDQSCDLDFSKTSLRNFSFPLRDSLEPGSRRRIDIRERALIKTLTSFEGPGGTSGPLKITCPAPGPFGLTWGAWSFVSKSRTLSIRDRISRVDPTYKSLDHDPFRLSRLEEYLLALRASFFRAK